ncbi:MAG: class I SAM-dependent methyltransferase [bacterium]|nr:class I SAM-dependent methyltransferase [bacterium]
MQTLEKCFADYRMSNFGLVGKLVYQDKPEILDIYPESDEAAQVVRDLESLAISSGLQKKLTDMLFKKFNSMSNINNSILEVCGGNCWLLRSAVAHATAKGLRIHAVGSDLSKQHVVSNQERFPNASIEWIVADATRLLFRDHEFDLVINCQALHHFQPMLVIEILKELNRVARKVVIFDLRRTVYGSTFVKLLTPFYSKSFISDGIASHRRAYSISEMKYLIQAAGLPYIVKPFTPVGMIVESIQ